jgi:RHS repeat-associated protein
MHLLGVPTTSTPAKYSWLGAEQQPNELPSGVIAMGARSYVPQLGRFLQTDPVPGGSADAYAYTFGDPVNTSDPSGELTYGFSGWLKAANDQEAKEVAEREVARETLEREEAERRAREAKEAEERADDPAPAVAEEPLGGYSGWACEYAAETGQEDSECGGGSAGGSTGDSLIGGENAWLEHHCQVGQLYFDKKCVQSRPPIVPTKPPNHPSGPNRQKESCGFLGFCPIISGERE